MLFWESTHIGFVAYPRWLLRLFDNKFFEYGLSFSTALLTLGSLVFSIQWTYRWRKVIFDPQETESADESQTLIFWILLLVLPYIGLYSLFMVITRFILPIAPLYLVMIAFSCDKILRKLKESR